MSAKSVSVSAFDEFLLKFWMDTLVLMLGCIETHPPRRQSPSSLNDGHDDNGDGFTEHEDE